MAAKSPFAPSVPSATGATRQTEPKGDSDRAPVTVTPQSQRQAGLGKLIAMKSCVTDPCVAERKDAAIGHLVVVADPSQRTRKRQQVLTGHVVLSLPRSLLRTHSPPGDVRAPVWAQTAGDGTKPEQDTENRKSRSVAKRRRDAEPGVPQRAAALSAPVRGGAPLRTNE